MAGKHAFYQAKAKRPGALEQSVPIVALVHGKHHPELFDVHKLFDVISQKIMGAGLLLPRLNEEFERLREITNGFTIPDSAGDVFATVCNLLEKLEQACLSFMGLD